MNLKSLIIKALKIGILAVGILTISIQAPYLHRSYIRNIAESSVVQIYGENGSGTGSHVQLPDGRIVILTNKHICEMKGPLMVQSENSPYPIERKIIMISKEHDLCAMEPLLDQAAISIGDVPEIGDELYILGHPRGEALNVSRGEYFDDKIITLGQAADLNGKCDGGRPKTIDTIFGQLTFCLVEYNSMQLSNPTYPGNSGSPVVNKYGQLVGVIFAGNTQVENTGYAVPLYYIIEFLSNL